MCVCVCVSHSVLSKSFVTPWTVALQAPLSVRFSRQEYWSGLPFPSSGDLPNPGSKTTSPALQAFPPLSLRGSPLDRVVQSLSRVQLFMTPWTVARQAPLFMGVLQAGILEWLLCPLPGELPNPGIKTRYLSLQVDSLLSESPGKPKSIGAGSLSILQGNFLTQESNRGLLHYSWILY